MKNGKAVAAVDETDMQAPGMGFPNVGEELSLPLDQDVEEMADDTVDDTDDGAGDFKATGTDDDSTDPQTAELTEQFPIDQEDPEINRRLMLAQVIAGTVDEIATFMPKVKEAEDRLDLAREEQKKATKGVEAVHLHLAMLCRRLADAKNGNYQPELPFGSGDAAQSGDAPTKKLPPVDQGAAMAIHVLADHGLTPKMCETLETHDVKTVGQLETLIRTNEWWHREIKGFGGERIDRTIDALMSFRRTHPVPTADDVEDQPEPSAD